MAYYANDFATAGTVDVNGGVLDGQLDTTNTDDYFRVVFDPGVDMFRVMVSADANQTIGVRMYDTTQTQVPLTGVVNGYLASDGYELRLKSPAADEYFVHVSRYGSDSTYALDFTALGGTVYTVSEIHDIPQIELRFERDSTWNIIKPASTGGALQHGAVPRHKTIFSRGGIQLIGHPMSIARGLGAIDKPMFYLHGTVKRQGAALANTVMRLYDRASGKLIGHTRSDGVGNWRFPHGLHENSKYYVIAFDDMDAPILQAVIHDALVPRLDA